MAKLCQANDPGQASWKGYYRAVVMVSLQCISVSLHFRANVLLPVKNKRFSFLSKPCFVDLYCICYFESFDEDCRLIPVYIIGYDQLFPIEIICE